MPRSSQTPPRPKKSSLQKSKVKTLLITFFDNKGIIHKKFVPVGQIINAALYQVVLNRLLQRIWWVPPEFQRAGKWMLLHDNSPAYRVRQFLARKMVAVLNHLPYSVIWLLRTSSCFPAWRRPSKVHVLQTWMLSEIVVTAVLRSIPQKTFADCFRKLYECCQADGDYFEGQETKFVFFILFVFW